MEYLHARIAEDEAVARAASKGPWWHNPGKRWLDPEPLARERAGWIILGGDEFVGRATESGTGHVASTGPVDDPQSVADADHIARWDPARVLADIATKRSLLSRHQEDRHRTGWCSSCYVPTGGHRLWPCHVVLAMAQSYVGRPDFRDEWRIGAGASGG